MSVDAKKPPTTRPQCGTDAGYFRHYRADERVCEDCRAAHIAINADRDAARQRAHTRLAHEHPERWRELYEQELGRRGIRLRKGAA